MKESKVFTQQQSPLVFFAHLSQPWSAWLSTLTHLLALLSPFRWSSARRWRRLSSRSLLAHRLALRLAHLLAFRSPFVSPSGSLSVSLMCSPFSSLSARPSSRPSARLPLAHLLAHLLAFRSPFVSPSGSLSVSLMCLMFAVIHWPINRIFGRMSFKCELMKLFNIFLQSRHNCE